MDNPPSAATPDRHCTAFSGTALLVSGPAAEVALAVKAELERTPAAIILVFDDATGRPIDFDLRGSDANIVDRLTQPAAAPDLAVDACGEPRGRGRPRLGVVAREVTLLPRHWAWLAAQPGGASVTLRKLVEDARRDGGRQQTRRDAREAAYYFMSAMAGNFPGFEEAARALFAGDRERFDIIISVWPDAVREHARKLGFGDG